jgi:hypothetical protein
VSPLVLSDVNKIRKYEQILVNSIRNHKNSFSGSRVVICGQTDIAERKRRMYL